uniref:Uncharacterized protein n=1 Tax=Glossina palpalis gambiensis TaxID=67801 RepID=A0A1B0AZQ2_9MUSC
MTNPSISSLTTKTTATTTDTYSSTDSIGITVTTFTTTSTHVNKNNEYLLPTSMPVSTASTSARNNKNNSIPLLFDNNDDDVELCRSCGKTNTELYDLFNTAKTTTSTAGTATSANTANTTNAKISPFNTSSTTCYSHLDAQSIALDNPSSAISTSGSSSTSGNNIGFDSVTATAKATAKGQSNMENILQEMHIWQLQKTCVPRVLCFEYLKPLESAKILSPYKSSDQ